jgi:Ca2+-transporting ATPase
MPVAKTIDVETFVFQGTTVTTGMALAEVTAIGNQTKLGQIGVQVDAIALPDTPLQVQINSFVKKMVLAGGLVFVVIWGVNYYLVPEVLTSLLKALTLAMSVIPEEIPVAFTTFMALGAWRLMKSGVVVKHTQTVETLGSATVICTDKTGTLTENKMVLAELFVAQTSTVEKLENQLSNEAKNLLEIAMWASEPIPFDPMEKALHLAYEAQTSEDKRPRFKLFHEYPLSGKPPMMTHIYTDNEGHKIIAAKGAPEALLAESSLSDDDKNKALNEATNLANQGYRVLGVGQSEWNDDNYPDAQQDFTFTFLGFVAFFDPPKKNMEGVFKAFYQAGIQVKIITGDSASTTATLAKQVGFTGADTVLEGDAIMALTDEQLAAQVSKTSLFARMYPEAKLRVINALKANGEIVAMTGDGVNDGPALKAASIGVAMGQRGSEIAKQAASLILIKDNFEDMVQAVAMGRRIYINLKKAIQYIISIHIPIILTVMLPLVLQWKFTTIFSPVHIIFLELIMGPTCSIIYENEPMERNLMRQKPRHATSTFFGWKELAASILQGLVITMGTLSAYLFGVWQGYSQEGTRSIIFLALISANIFLTFVNRSYFDSVWQTLKRKNNLVYVITSITVALTICIYSIPFLKDLFGLGPITLQDAGLAIGLGAATTFWFELVKIWRRRRA